jgi:hypothetical protein
LALELGTLRRVALDKQHSKLKEFARTNIANATVGNKLNQKLKELLRSMTSHRVYQYMQSKARPSHHVNGTKIQKFTR